jgi:hypothetical protein
VIASHWWPLTALLRKDPRFQVVYEDLVSVLFEATHDEQSSGSSQPASSKTQAR